jgi:hypothetical protein
MPSAPPLNLKILSIAFNASSLAPKTLAVSTYAEKTQLAGVWEYLPVLL